MASRRRYCGGEDYVAEDGDTVGAATDSIAWD